MSNFENARNAFVKAEKDAEVKETANAIKEVASLFESGGVASKNKGIDVNKNRAAYEGPKVGKVADLFSKPKESFKKEEEVKEQTASERFADAARMFGSNK